ncbi:MAG: glycosyltransferase family 39 protein [Candidatus Desulfofervidus auxilii]|nr:glycosyltransferase family 39 protein [Candidatus Desulfofervidus auxilii]
MPNTKKLLLIILFAIIIRIPYINCPMHPDEGAYAYQGYFWLKGKEIYETRFFNRLPGLPLIYATAFKLFGTNPKAIRVFVILYNTLSVLFVYLIGCKLLDEKKALISAFIFAYLSWSPIMRGVTGKEIFIILPCLITIYFYLLYEGKNKKFLFLCGIFSGFSILVSQTTFLLIFHFLIFTYFQSKKKIKDLSVYLFSLCIPVMLFLIHGALVLGIKQLIYQIIIYRTKSNSIFVGPAWYHLFRSIYSLTASSFIFLIFAIILGYQYLPKEEKFVKFFLFSYLIFSFLGAISGGWWAFHYYLPLMPIISLWLGWCIPYIFKQKRLVKAIFFCCLLVPLIFYICAFYYTKNYCLEFKSEYKLTKKLVKYLNNHCGKKIYAFLFYNPSIYFMSKKESALPYFFEDEILFVPERFKEIISVIKQKKIDCLITYDLDYSLEMVQKLCDTNKPFMFLIKKCFSRYFTPFCKGYPIQLSFIKKIFEMIPSYYKKIKIIPFKKGKIIIWKKQD